MNGSVLNLFSDRGTLTAKDVTPWQTFSGTGNEISVAVIRLGRLRLCVAPRHADLLRSDADGDHYLHALFQGPAAVLL